MRRLGATRGIPLTERIRQGVELFRNQGTSVRGIAVFASRNHGVLERLNYLYRGQILL